MAWARLDDGFYDHPKVVEMLDAEGMDGLAAVGLWTLTLTYAHKHRKRTQREARVTKANVRRLVGSDGLKLAGLLVLYGLWDASTDGSTWTIHDFDQYLPSEETSNARAEAGRKGGLAKAKNRSSELADSSSEPESSSNGLASVLSTPLANTGSGIGSTTEVPVGVPSVGRASKRGQRLPNPYPITEEMRTWGRERVPHINAKLEHEKFCNYWWSKTGQATKIDWFKTWQNWMLSAAEKTGRPPVVQDALPADPRDEWMHRR